MLRIVSNDEASRTTRKESQMQNSPNDQGQRNIGEGTPQGDKPKPEKRMPQHQQEERKQPGQGGDKQRQWNDPEEREQQGGQR
jgi:hypothetical protein